MIEKCTGIKGEDICPFRDSCKRYLEEPQKKQLWLSFSPFKGNECQFFYDKRRDYLERKAGHLNFDNTFEYVYENKRFVKYRINWEQNKSTGLPL